MGKSKGMPAGLLQRLQQSSAARARNVGHKLTTESFSIDLRHVPEPDRIYYARDGWVEYAQGVASFYFCQRRRDGEKKLRSLICVNMSPDHAARLLRSIDEMASPSLSDISEQ